MYYTIRECVIFIHCPCRSTYWWTRFGRCPNSADFSGYSATFSCYLILIPFIKSDKEDIHICKYNMEVKAINRWIYSSYLRNANEFYAQLCNYHLNCNRTLLSYTQGLTLSNTVLHFPEAQTAYC